MHATPHSAEKEFGWEGLEGLEGLVQRRKNTTDLDGEVREEVAHIDAGGR